jgi:hypothetical protein
MLKTCPISLSIHIMQYDYKTPNKIQTLFLIIEIAPQIFVKNIFTSIYIRNVRLCWCIGITFKINLHEPSRVVFEKYKLIKILLFFLMLFDDPWRRHFLNYFKNSNKESGPGLKSIGVVIRRSHCFNAVTYY